MSTPPNNDHLSNSIAVIGMSCRYPQAPTPEAYWELLRNGVECVVDITEEDLIKAGMNPEIMHHPNFVSRQVVLDDIDAFDADFFNYFPRDAEILDPQQRLMLECAWEALESAGYIPEKCEEMIGIYAGSDMSQYLFNLYSNREVMESAGLFQINLANDKDHVTTRVAYKLNLNGPAVTVQTTCSTSLVAIAMACQSLFSYQSDIALAGGTAIAISQRVGYVYQEGGIASPDGYCRAFDARAQGTIGGSGTGVVVLKRMEDAIADRDQIHAVIRGFALNNDGAGKVGYTAPSIEGQSEVISMAQAMAEVDPEDITYVEAHGTATPLGDPIEIRALTEAFRTNNSKTNYCGIGSVKTNFGHMNSAAGVGSFMKVVLSLKNRMIPPSLHFETPNPNIDFHNSPFYVVKELQKWENGDTPLRAGVSSFGIGGTNAHVVLEEAPSLPQGSEAQDWLLLLFSARSEKTLDHLLTKFGNYLDKNPALNLADVAFTLQLGRRDFRYRKFLLIAKEDSGKVVQKLQNPGLPASRVTEENRHEISVVFMFSGQGSQYINMSKALYETNAFFKAEVDACCAHIKEHTGKDILSIIFPPAGEEAAAAKALQQTENTQPALFIIEYALAKLWISWGVRPKAMVGHSIGEYVAACLAGVFSLEDCLLIVVERGRLMQSMPKGAMLSIPMPEEDVLSMIDAQLSVSVLNSPDQTVVSGCIEAIDDLQNALEAKDISCQRLQTSHAFHSHMFNPVIGVFAEMLGQYNMSAPSIPFVSNNSGTWIQEEEATNPNYWAMHLRQPVRFFENIQTLNETPGQLFLEIGPGTTLQRLSQNILKGTDTKIFSSLPHPKDTSPSSRYLTNTLGQLWLQGLKPDWKGYYGDEARSRISLPTYPFEKKRFWISPPTASDVSTQNGAQKNDMSEWFYTPKWELAASNGQSVPAETSTLSQHQWLIFLDKSGYGKSFQKYLQEQNKDQVILVKMGKSFARKNTNEFTINPESKADYKLLLEALQVEDRLPDILLHFWNIDHLKSLDLKEAKAFKYAGFYSLLFFSQALSAIQPDSPCSIRVFTKELYGLKSTDQPSPGQALSVGAGKVIQQEMPNLFFQNIDLNGTLLEKETIGQILSDHPAKVKNPEEELITAWRDNQKWKLSYQKTNIDEINQLKLRFRPGGVYLITGGMGGIGSIIAKFLAIKYRAKLVLLNRTPLLPRSKWDQYLLEHEKEGSDRTCRKINLIRDLEGFGAKVHNVAIDITDRKELKKLQKNIEKQFGRLHGIVHSAGVAGGGIIPLKTEEEAQRVLAPKVDGTLALHEVFGEKELDFFILCSSLSAILGGMGQIDYCAANSFQDAFAHQSLNKSTYYLSINWDTWGEVGMAVETEVPENMKQWQKEGLKRGIRNVEGMQLFELLMSSNLPQIATSTTNLYQRYHHVPDNTEAPQVAEQTVTMENATASHQRPDLTTDYVKPTNPTEEKVAFVWQELLGITPIGISDNFLELGGHSLLAIQLISRLRDVFGQEISIQDFFEVPTIAAVAKRLAPQESTRSLKADEDQPIGDSQMIRRVSRSDYRITLEDEDVKDMPDAFKEDSE